MFFYALTFEWSRGSLFEHEAYQLRVQTSLDDPASVNVMKQKCVIVILAYFTLFHPNSY